MNKPILLFVVVVSVFGVVRADETAEEPKLGLTLDLTYTSKWLSKGVEAYGSQGGLFETLDLDFYGTGLGVKVTHRNATGSGYVDNQRFDYRPYYKGLMFEGEPYATNFNISTGYEHYYGLSRTKANTTWESILACSWPQLLGNGLVPKYIVHYETPATSEGPFNYIAGWVHRFLLDYHFNVDSLPYPVTFSSELAYYDGLGGKTHDWAYTTFGLTTLFKFKNGVSFVPGIYQQITLDDSISQNQDITYGMFSVKYAF